jgi:hypothetical protein
VDRNVVPVLNAKLDDGRLSTGQPAYRELFHLFVGLAAAAENFDGNGHTIRYGAGFGESSLATALPSSIGDLVSLGQDKVVGARPRYTPNTEPPFEPTASCTEQDLPDLKAESRPATVTRSRSMSAATSRRAVSDAIAQARKGGVAARARKALTRAAKQEAGR